MTARVDPAPFVNRNPPCPKCAVRGRLHRVKHGRLTYTCANADCAVEIYAATKMAVAV